MNQTPKAVAAAAMMALSMLISMHAGAAPGLNVTTAHNDPKELALKMRLEKVVQQYALDKWLYTKDIRIDQEVWPPHSHPVLTLGVRDALLSDDVYLVGAVLHEEFHWNMVLNGRSMPAESAALVKAQFPGLDPRAPEGAGNDASTYGHVLVCYMEYKALASIFGKDAARKSIKALPFYRGIYALVTDEKNQAAIEELMRNEEVHI
jgi:hypothetical protein